MNKEVLKYFNKLNTEKLQKRDGAVIITPESARLRRPLNRNVSEYCILGQDYYVKKFNDTRNIGSIITAEMYDELGILTPKSQLAEVVSPDLQSRTLSTISKSVLNLPGYEVVLAYQILQMIALKFSHLDNKWELLSNPQVRDYFLLKMTPECFDKFIGLFLVDELRTEIDRHILNYFLIRKSGEHRYSDIITIDHDWMYVLKYPQNVDQLKDMTYSSYTPTDARDFETYGDRITAIINLLHNGKLSENNITLLQSAIKYDLPKTTRKLFKSSPIISPHKAPACDAISKLWDYNRKTLGKELGL